MLGVVIFMSALLDGRSEGRHCSPIRKRSGLAMAALLPMVPLVLLIYPFASLAIKLLEGIAGL